MKTMKQNGKTKKVLDIIVSAVTYTLLFLTLILLGLVFTARVKGEIPTIYGYSVHIVVTDSMSTGKKDSIDVGDMVFVRYTSKDEIKVGDIILFISADPASIDAEGRPLPILHRVKEINDAENEENITFVTKGDATPVDPYPAKNVKGVMVAKSAFLGRIFYAFLNWRNMLFLFVIIMLLFSTAAILKRLLGAVKEGHETLTAEDKDRIAREVAEKLKEEVKKDKQ